MLENKEKLLNIKVTVILIVINALEPFPGGLIKQLEDLDIRSTTILRKGLETIGDLQSLKLY